MLFRSRRAGHRPDLSPHFTVCVLIAPTKTTVIHGRSSRHGRTYGPRVCASAFWGASLGDRRRAARLVQVGAAFAQGGGGQSGGTISSVICDRHQAKAAYRLLDREQVTHEAVLSGHCAEVLKATSLPGDYLLIEDTTAIAYPNLKQTTGLGPIGEDHTRGLWAHQTLVVKVDWQHNDAQLLGMLGQRVWARPLDRPYKRSLGKEPERARQSREDRESQRWMAALEQAEGAIDGTTWTYVADRESDIYELFQKAWVHGWSFVIRASHRRALAGHEVAQHVLTAAATAPVRGTTRAKIKGGEDEMLLEVRSTTLTLRGPSRPGGRLEDHTVNVVHARQLDAPADQEPACWILLTDLPVDTLAQSERVLSIYRHRWPVEELHKALKTGLKIEASQLSDARRLGALIGILSVVAVFLLQHKLAARSNPQAPLNEDETDQSILAVLRKTDPPRGRATRRWYWIAIAKLGGYHDRKTTQPGWLTLWRGWQTLMMLVRGYELARGP